MERSNEQHRPQPYHRAEIHDEAHRRLREEVPALKEKKMKVAHGFHKVPQTGVIYVMTRASEEGFHYGSEDWSNLGQGAPEVGTIPDALDRPINAFFDASANEYAPVAGITELRQAVADLYNARYRKDKASKYTWKNVCITPGGRASLTRVAAAIGNVYVGFFLPEYTAYEEMLAIFKKFVAIPHALDANSGYGISPEELRREIRSRGLGVVVTSNPSNPTGKLIEGDDLKQWVTIGAEMKCSMVFDEFYSAYIWSHGPENNGRTVSAAEFVEDVNKDPVIIVDGLTKSWRLPGWRISWVVAPEEVIKAVSSSGSFLDGGANNPLQHSAVALLNPEFANNDVKAVQAHFRQKRQYMIDTLLRLGFKLDAMPMGTFYVWADVSGLPSPLDNGISFFEAALKEKVICVPGLFFDINPGKRRELESSPYHNYIRFSYGPSFDELKRGLDAIERLVARTRQSNGESGNQ